MSRRSRLVTVFALAVAIVATPLVLDGCAASCEAHDNVAATPTCHHVASTALRVGANPASCGHDHAGLAAAPVTHVTSIQRTFDAPIALLAAPLPARDASQARFEPAHAPPGSSLTLGTHSLPLRI